VSRPIIFLSDFGYRNEWVGICHAVMNRIAPQSVMVDLSHGIPPLDVQAGAVLVADSLPYIGEDAIVLAVVEPNVGRDRDIAIETGNGRLLVGPDNGLLAPAWRESEGVARAVSITAPDVVLEPVAPTFHARDVLAPAAASLAVGMPLERLGEPLVVETLADLELPQPIVEAGKIQCEVVDLNRFGNVLLNVRQVHLEAAGLDGNSTVGVETQATATVAARINTYADLAPGDWGLMVDARGWLAVVRGNPANAAEGLAVGSGDLVWLLAPER
jgi:S-adenosyl-L-methionine hydrolase (adenosine-forming)